MKRWGWSVLVAIDQLGNALTGGDADETISSRLGKWKRKRITANAWPPAWYHPARWLDAGLDRIDPNHSLDAIECDEAERCE